MKSVVRRKGTLIFNIDGEEVYPAAYMSYCPNDADYEGFKALGYKLFSYCVYASNITPSEQTGLLAGWDNGCWPEENRFDFSPLDRGMKRLLGENFEEELYIILRINLNMPRWWREKYPDELMWYNDGKSLMQSVWSVQWRKDASRFLDALKSHIESSGYGRQIIAWQVAAMNTEEWMHPIRKFYELKQDKPWYSAFISYTKKKYQSIDSVNAAWGTDYADFESITVPAEKEMREKSGVGKKASRYNKVIDYYKTLNDGYAETVTYFTRYIKSIFNGNILCGAFYGYIGASSDTQGHCSVSKLLVEPSINFFASPFAYVNARDMGIDWIYHSPVTSADRCNKIWFLEADVRTNLTRHLRETRPELFPGVEPYFDNPVFFGPDTVKQSCNNIIRSFSKFFISQHAYWWFDMWGGWYKNAEYMSLLEKLYGIYNRKMQTEVKSKTEVAVIMDENGAYITSGGGYHKCIYSQLVELGFLGAPYDSLLINDVKESDIDNYKLVIFLSPDSESEKYKQLEGYIKKTGVPMLKTCQTADGITNFDRTSFAEEARKHGVHLYSEGNIVYVNERYIAVTAVKSGEVSLSLMSGQAVRNLLTGEILPSTDGKITFNAKFNDCLLFEIL